MDLVKEITAAQRIVMSRVAAAARERDFGKVAHWSSLAKECESLGAEIRTLVTRVTAVRGALNGNTAPIPIVTKARGQSPRSLGVNAREQWINQLSASGIRLIGHRKRYQTAKGKTVGAAYASELDGLRNKWFLGLTDEPTDVAVLLCGAANGKLYDIVIPVDAVGSAWRELARANGQIKFNVRKEGGTFLMLIPRGNALDVTKYVGNHGPLR